MKGYIFIFLCYVGTSKAFYRLWFNTVRRKRTASHIEQCSLWDEERCINTFSSVSNLMCNCHVFILIVLIQSIRSFTPFPQTRQWFTCHNMTTWTITCTPYSDIKCPHSHRYFHCLCCFWCLCCTECPFQLRDSWMSSSLTAVAWFSKCPGTFIETAFECRPLKYSLPPTPPLLCCQISHHFSPDFSAPFPQK